MEYIIENGYLDKIVGVGEVIEIPAGVKSTKRFCFLSDEQCKAVKTVILPEGIYDLGRLFEDCENLETVYLPESIKNVKGMFKGCPNLKTIHYTSLDAFWYQETDVYSRLAFDELYIGDELMTTFPFPKDLKAIPHAAFAGWRGVEVLTIPEGVKEIGSYAFRGCSHIKTIVFPKSLETIAADAFSDCIGLEELVLPKKLEKIGNYAFSHCDSLKRVYFPDSLEDMADGAFVGIRTMEEWHFNSLDTYFRCNKLADAAYQDLYIGGKKIDSLVFPQGMTEIPECTCWGFRGLKQVTIPEGVTRVGSGAFLDCQSLETVVFPESIVSLWGAFQKCDNLKTLSFPTLDAFFRVGSDRPRYETLYIGGVLMKELPLDGFGEAIDKEAYAAVGGIVDLVIPEGVKTIGDNAFSKCPDLCRVTLPKSLETLGEYAFSECPKLKSVVFSEGITAIDAYTFDGCHALEAVHLPNSLKTIGESAFSGCYALADLNLSRDVDIKWSSFSYCATLDENAYLSVGDEGRAFYTVCQDDQPGAKMIKGVFVKKEQYSKADAIRILKEAHGYAVYKTTETDHDEYGRYSSTEKYAIDRHAILVKDKSFVGVLTGGNQYHTHQSYPIAYWNEQAEDSIGRYHSLLFKEETSGESYEETSRYETVTSCYLGKR